MILADHRAHAAPVREAATPGSCAVYGAPDLMYQCLKDRGGQQTAYEIVRACVLPIGLALRQGNFRAVEAPRTFDNLVAYQQRINRPYTLQADGVVVMVGSIKAQVIATPGHTPGSMSELVDDGVLFTGKSLRLQNDQVYPFYRLVNMNTATQEQSIRKLTRLQNVALLCTAHTGSTTDYERAMVHWRPQEAGTKHV